MTPTRISHVHRLSLLVALMATIPAGCDSSSAPPESLVGTWSVTEVEGAAGPVDETNSLWIFRSDGTYTWFFHFDPFFDLEGTGNYSLSGSTLTVDGVVDDTIISETPDGRIPLSFGDNTFSFRDDDGDRWTYVRR